MDIKEIVLRYGMSMRHFIQDLNRGNPDAPRQLCDDIQGRIEELKAQIYPHRDDFDAQVNRPTTLTLAHNAWSTLRDTCLEGARAAFDDLLQYASDTKPKKPKKRSETEEWLAALELRAAACRRLLRLWMETGLYQLRMRSNFEYLAISHRKDEIEVVNHHRVTQLAEITEEYQKKLHEWNGKLYKHIDKHLLAYWFEDADHIALLSTAFGPGPDMLSKEVGWAQVATEAGAKLHYKAQETRRRTYWQNGKPLQSLRLLCLNLLTAHNTKNWRLAFLPILVLVLSGLGYVLDDSLLSGCASAQALPGSIGEYIAYTFNVLAGVGRGGFTPCGPNHLWMSTAETFAGYLSLALLASLLFEYLNKRKL